MEKVRFEVDGEPIAKRAFFQPRSPVDCDGCRKHPLINIDFRIDQEKILDRKLSVTIESLGDGLVVCDSAGIVTAVNPRMRVPAGSLRRDRRSSAIPKAYRPARARSKAKRGRSIASSYALRKRLATEREGGWFLPRISRSLSNGEGRSGRLDFASRAYHIWDYARLRLLGLVHAPSPARTGRALQPSEAPARQAHRRQPGS
jgi:PAS domain-containing protein